MLLTGALHKRNKPLIGADDRVEGFSALGGVGLGFRATFVDSPPPPLYFLVDAVIHEQLYTANLFKWLLASRHIRQLANPLPQHD
jgi:hypothetical protein